MPGWLEMVQFATIGKPLSHDSAELHVQGNAPYIDDVREPEGTLHVVPGYAAKGACGKITLLDLKSVREAPGVIAVLTAGDIPGLNDCSASIGGDPILADGEIKFHGQVIFAVVATSRDAARRAVRLARIEIATTSPAVNVDDAVAMQTDDV